MQDLIQNTLKKKKKRMGNGSSGRAPAQQALSANPNTAKNID
jgi:hypothetical protein